MLSPHAERGDPNRFEFSKNKSDTASRSRRGLRARFAVQLPPSAKGAGNAGAPDAPAASCAHGVVSMHTSIHSEFTGITRHCQRNGFTAYLYRALPGDRLVATVAR
jgi:hypothetical protein